MAIMVAIVSTILSQCQILVRTSQQQSAANATCGAIADLFRDDLRHVTTNGFLCITQNNAGATCRALASPRLIFTVASPTASMVGNYNAPAAIITYAIVCPNNDPVTYPDPNNYLLVRQQLLLDTDNTSASRGIDTLPPTASTDLSYSFANIGYQNGSFSRQNVNTFITNLYTGGAFATALGTPGVPATSLAQSTSNISILATGCVDLAILWTDGNMVDWPGMPRTVAETKFDPNLNWFGGWFETAPTNSNVYVGKLSSVSNDANAVPGFTDTTCGKRWLWTHREATAWPKAVRIDFKLKQALSKYLLDPTRNTGYQYEVIATVGE